VGLLSTTDTPTNIQPQTVCFVNSAPVQLKRDDQKSLGRREVRIRRNAVMARPRSDWSLSGIEPSFPKPGCIDFSPKLPPRLRFEFAVKSTRTVASLLKMQIGSALGRLHAPLY